MRLKFQCLMNKPKFKITTGRRGTDVTPLIMNYLS
jgi:hypothetical protein